MQDPITDDIQLPLFAIERHCSGCDSVLPLESFHKKPGGRFGHASICRECTAVRKKAYYEANRERFLEASKRNWWANREQRLAQRAVWYQENKDRVSQAGKGRYRKHREAILARNRIYHVKNRDSIRENKRKWRDRNRLHVRLKNRTRRMLSASVPGSATIEQVQARIDFYGGRCWMCGAPYEHIDHVIPLSRGGSNWPANLRPACAHCNLSKHDRLPSEL